MDQRNRLRIGILFNVSRNWLGGVYYIINLIKSLNFLDDEDKPEIIVFYSSELEDFNPQIEYTYLKFVPWTFESPLMGYLKSWFKRKNLFVHELTNLYELDGLYPVWNQPIPADKAFDERVKAISWFADLQHRQYPEFFSKKQWLMREARLRLMLKNANDLVVSSQASKKDFKKFYHLREDLNIHVLNFVSIIDDFKFDNISELRIKYGLPDRYFMISNQFHKHKNHLLLLKALTLLKKEGSPVHFAITGKMPEDNHSPYIRSLYELLYKHQLGEWVHFLGVIPRQHQLSLMKHSKAIVQPSLFEGWSTVIEDGKSLQVPVIASDLEVNREQLGNAGTYFNPHNEKELAEILSTFKNSFSDLIYNNYENRVKSFAINFLRIFK